VPIVKEKVWSRQLGQWRHPELLGGAKNIDHVTERERPGLNPQRITVSPHEPVRHQPSHGATAELGGICEEHIETLTLPFRVNQEPG
jgi:hypothetical protein